MISSRTETFAASLALSLAIHASLLSIPLRTRYTERALVPQASARLDARILIPLAVPEAPFRPESLITDQSPAIKPPPPPSIPDAVFRPPTPSPDSPGSQGTASYYRSSEVDESAMPIDPPVLLYPENAYRKRIGGTVVLKVYVSASGGIDEIKVESSDPPGIFEKASLQAVLAMRFKPAKLAGKSVDNEKRIEVTFDPYESIGLP